MQTRLHATWYKDSSGGRGQSPLREYGKSATKFHAEIHNPSNPVKKELPMTAPRTFVRVENVETPEAALRADPGCTVLPPTVQ
jgi:hypothetical protein